MALKHKVKNFARRFGFDVVRYPLHEPVARTARLLAHHDVECVIDVGANDGGFASAIRQLGYTERIISFEPLAEPFEVLSRKAEADGIWDAHRLAIGNRAGDIEINVSGNAGLSSSVLPMLDAHLNIAPGSRFIGTETVQQDRLDSVLPKLGVAPSVRSFLKIDVQGYEGAVLEGAAGLLGNGGVVGLQLELSLTPLYADGMTYRQGLDWGESLGMTLMGLDPVFADPKTGQLLQADAVFFLSR